MNFIKNIKKSINKCFLYIRGLFIKEKRIYISSKTFDNINFNFKNIQVYSEIGMYKTIFSLFFIVIFLSIVLYFAYLDFKTNINHNKQLIKIEPLELVVDSPLTTDLIQDYKDVVYKIKAGDNLLSILTDIVKVSHNDAYSCIDELKQVYNINELQVGQKLFIKYKDDVELSGDSVVKTIRLEELRLVDDLLAEEITVSRNADNQFIANREKVALSQTYNKYIVKITNSVYVDSINAGIPVEIVLDLMKYYSFNIDFQRDIRKGDWLEVVFEAFYTENGKKVRNGNIIYSNMHVKSIDNKLYRFNDNGVENYFNEKGETVQRSLLKTPINGARISSGYANKRKHPVLGYTRAHKGIDFAAPVGTPFYAAGNGTVTKIITGCRNGDRRCGGGFGNYVAIKHNKSYTTEYAHISKIAKHIRVGTQVKRGEVIAYVGTTGLSSGPHLHYGVIFNGNRINPNNIKDTPDKRLEGKTLLDFVETRDRINAMRASAINQNMMENEG